MMMMMCFRHCLHWRRWLYYDLSSLSLEEEARTQRSLYDTTRVYYILAGCSNTVTWIQFYVADQEGSTCFS